MWSFPLPFTPSTAILTLSFAPKALDGMMEGIVNAAAAAPIADVWMKLLLDNRFFSFIDFPDKVD